jgi:2-methylcitrate dehydratase PrpD
MQQAACAGLSSRVAGQLLGVRFDALGEGAVRAASRALLDAVGVMQAASGLCVEAAPFVDLAVEQGGRAEATILGTGLRVPASHAAFANGALAHALDYEDVFDGAPVHPNAALIPAVLALAQSDPRISGRDLLTAIVVGCETVCRIALSLRRPLEHGGWYPPPILGAWGAVAGAAHLLHLSPRQLVDAWSLMLLQTSAPGEIRRGDDSAIRGVREAFPAQTAVTAVRLAQRDVRGFPAPLEGREGFYRLFAGGEFDPAGLDAPPGPHWHIESLSFKPWPSCRGTHAAIECALHLRNALGDPLRLSHIVVEGNEVQQMLAEPRARKCAPATAIEAKFSLPFTVAAALVDGRVDLDTFAPANLSRPELQQVAARVQFERHGSWPRSQAVSGALRGLRDDGAGLRKEILVPLGAPQRPLEEAGLVRKFVDCCARARCALQAEAAQALAARLLSIAQEPSVAALPWN